MAGNTIALLTRTARERPLVLLAWLIALALAGRFIAADLFYALGHGGLNAAPGTLLGRDFVNVVSGGHAVIEGKLSLIYDVTAYQQFQSTLFDGRVAGHNYSYSPVSFLYVPLFTFGGYGLAYLLWMTLTGGLFLLAARPYLRDAEIPAWLALLAPASLMNIWAGHYGFLVGALWLSAWRLLDSRPRAAGVLVGLLIVKPHLAVLMPILLLRRGAWSAIFSAAATAIGLVLLSGLIFGWNYWFTYLTETSALQATMVAESSGFFVRMMPTVYPAFLLAGLDWAGALGLQALIATGVIAALWKWLPDDAMQAGLAGATATFLVLPYAFNYDLTVVSIAALVALHRSQGVAPPLARFVPAFAFLLPLLVVSINQARIPAAPAILGLFLAMQLVAARRAAAVSQIARLHPA